MWKELLQWRDDVLRRDEYKCVECGSTKNLEADHIKSFIAYPKLRLDISNGRTLCQDCHRKTHNYGVGAKKEVLIANCENNPLDREAWIALGKGLGWRKRDTAWGAYHQYNCEGEEWLYYWHALIDHLAEEGTIETYFETIKGLNQE